MPPTPIGASIRYRPASTSPTMGMPGSLLDTAHRGAPRRHGAPSSRLARACPTNRTTTRTRRVRWRIRTRIRVPWCPSSCRPDASASRSTRSRSWHSCSWPRCSCCSARHASWIVGRRRPGRPPASPGSIPSASPSPTGSASQAPGTTGSPGVETGTPSVPPVASPTGTPLASPTGDPVLVGAGDIGRCGSDDDEATAALLDGIAGTVFTAGDNAYEQRHGRAVS